MNERERIEELLAENKQLRDELETLQAAAAEMRHTQREYFRTKSQSALAAAKAAERKLDKLLDGMSVRRLL